MEKVKVVVRYSAQTKRNFGKAVIEALGHHQTRKECKIGRIERQDAEGKNPTLRMRFYL